MASLAEEIAKLSDPTPQLIDPEDFFNSETSARVEERCEEDLVLQSELSGLRQQTAPLLADIDARYAGKVVSRKSLHLEHAEEEESESSDYEESEEDSEFEVKLNNFHKRISEAAAGDGEKSGESEESDSVGNSDGDQSEEDDADDDEDEKIEIDILQKFSQIDVNEEIEKGKAVEGQISLWNKLSECRIRFQKILVAANKLPQCDAWDDFKKKGDKNYSDTLEKGATSLKILLDNMLELQSALFQGNTETSNLTGAVHDSLARNKSDEEITSSSEGENEKCEAKSVKSPSKVNNKRKLKLDDYEDILAKRFKTFVPYRNSVIQKWDDRTRLTTGGMKHKSFSAFNQSALKQIDQILQDKQRLIRRTQLKRSVYHILGKDEESENAQMSGEEKEETEGQNNRDEHLKCYDPEIFDDDDFYRVLLKDIIESKTVGMDPDVLRKHMELQKVRSRMKKKVDTKASKGRKIRYDVHPKMADYMAPENISSFSERAKEELFRSLFGQTSTVVAL